MTEHSSDCPGVDAPLSLLIFPRVFRPLFPGEAGNRDNELGDAVVIGCPGGIGGVPPDPGSGGREGGGTGGRGCRGSRGWCSVGDDVSRVLSQPPVLQSAVVEAASAATTRLFPITAANAAFVSGSWVFRGSNNRSCNPTSFGHAERRRSSFVCVGVWQWFVLGDEMDRHFVVAISKEREKQNETKAQNNPREVMWQKSNVSVCHATKATNKQTNSQCMMVRSFPFSSSLTFHWRYRHFHLSIYLSINLSYH